MTRHKLNTARQALVAMLALPALSFAASGFTNVPNPGFYRLKVGDLEVIALSDGTHPFPVSTVMRGTSPEEISHGLEHDFVDSPPTGSINAYLVNTGKKVILVDSGAGALYGDCCGQVAKQIQAAGYRAEDVDEVLITHLHKDHVGGIADGQRRVFPNATVRVSGADMAYWSSASQKADAPAFLSTFFDTAKASLAPYVAAGKVSAIPGPGVLEDGVSAIQTPGHTPGHLSYAFTSRGETLVVWGDIVHVAALQFREPKITVQYDSDGAAAQASRESLMQEAAQKKYLIAAAHVSFPGLGHVRQNGNSFEWVAVNYVAVGRP